MSKKKHQEESEQQDPGGAVYHVPVLLKPAVDALVLNPSGIYVDCTFGGGGHSKEILSRLSSDGKLYAFDQDADARKNLPDDDRIVFVPHNFRHLQRFLRLHKVSAVDGILAVSVLAVTSSMNPPAVSRPGSTLPWICAWIPGRN
jgi:16S rRNA (cytosine1402-N4)-methyltransferase